MTTESNSRRKARRDAGVLIFLSLALVLSTPVEAKQRIEFLGNGRGVRDLATTTKERAARQSSLVQVQGTAAQDARTGLRLGKLHVRITPATSVYPTVPGVDLALRPARLSGRHITVFGRRFGDTLVAQMLIVEGGPSDRLGLRIDTIAEQRWIEPSETGAATGRFLEGTPE